MVGPVALPVGWIPTQTTTYYEITFYSRTRRRVPIGGVYPLIASNFFIVHRFGRLRLPMLSNATPESLCRAVQDNIMLFSNLPLVHASM